MKSRFCLRIAILGAGLFIGGILYSFTRPTPSVNEMRVIFFLIAIGFPATLGGTGSYFYFKTEENDAASPNPADWLCNVCRGIDSGECEDPKNCSASRNKKDSY